MLNLKHKTVAIIFLSWLCLPVSAQTFRSFFDEYRKDSYLFAEAGISSAQPTVQTALLNSGGQPDYTSFPVRKISFAIGGGGVLKNNLTAEFAFSRSAFGNNIEVRGLVQDSLAPNLGIVTGNYFNVWNFRFSAGYQLKYRRFEFSPLIGIALPFLEATDNITTSEVRDAGGSWTVNILSRSTISDDRQIVFWQARLPIKCQFRLNDKYQLGLGYVFTASFSQKDFLTVTHNYTAAAKSATIVASNNGNYFSHVLAVYLTRNYFSGSGFDR